MTLDILHTLDVMKTALLRDLGDEVELIFRYGSHLAGTTHPYSDVDISYVPVQEETWKSITVLVADTMIDLYPIHWSQLERLANFDAVEGTVLLNHQIVYQRDEAAALRLRGLAQRLRVLQQPEARPQMLEKAQQVFERTGYSYYLLRQQAGQGHLLATLQQAQNLLKIILHTLAVCNQRCVDTRKPAQVLALPKLPAGFAGMVDRFSLARTPVELLAACEALLDGTRGLLVSEQRQLLRSDKSFAEVFGAGYPELKGGLQHVMLACERQDMVAVRDDLMTVYHEVMIHLAQALTGVRYSGFNSLAEYEQELGCWGFPELWPYVLDEDYTGLRGQCEAFDRRLRDVLSEHGVGLYDFASTEALQRSLGVEANLIGGE